MLLPVKVFRFAPAGESAGTPRFLRYWEHYTILFEIINLENAFFSFFFALRKPSGQKKPAPG